MRVIAAQLGSRMHYAVPRILSGAGMLAHFHTDLLGDRGWPVLARAVPPGLRTGGIRRMLGRRLPDVPRNRVTAHWDLTLRGQRRLSRARSAEETFEAHAWMGDELCRRILRSGIGNADAVFVVGSSSRLLFAEARRRGCRTIMESIIASPRLERTLLESEGRRHPEWADGNGPAASGGFERMAEEEYALSDLIVCGSEFVRDSIRQCGGPVERCVVVPYGVSQAVGGSPRHRERGSALKVLTVGAVGLRKGLPYVAEAARMLRGACEFRVVGPLHAGPEAARRLSAEVDYRGPVPKSQIGEHYGWADVFLLPSICEGSATVIYEALGQGLPVVTTANSGSVVTDGRDGILVPICDSPAIVESLKGLADSPARCEAMSAAALETARTYSYDRYASRLTEAVTSLGARSS
jgi:glycosyltransferase involved in cell wall biosynthesis